MRLPAFFITAAFELYYLSKWFLCGKLEDRFYYSAFDLKLRLEEAAHNDVSVWLPLVRFFHNKIVGTLVDSFSHYIQYIDIFFLTQLLSPLGVFSFICGIYYGMRLKEKRIFIISLIIFLLLPLVEMFLRLSFPFPAKIIILALPMQLISVFGIWRFFSAKKNLYARVVVVVILLLLSIGWLSVFPDELFHHCFPK